MGAVRFCRHIAPVMREARRGAIVDNASLAALRPAPHFSAYTATSSAPRLHPEPGARPRAFRCSRERRLPGRHRDPDDRSWCRSRRCRRRRAERQRADRTEATRDTGGCCPSRRMAGERRCWVRNRRSHACRRWLDVGVVNTSEPRSTTGDDGQPVHPQPLGGNEMPRFGGPATFMRLGPNRPAARCRDRRRPARRRDVQSAGRPLRATGDPG